MSHEPSIMNDRFTNKLLIAQVRSKTLEKLRALRARSRGFTQGGGGEPWGPGPGSGPGPSTRICTGGTPVRIHIKYNVCVIDGLSLLSAN